MHEIFLQLVFWTLHWVVGLPVALIVATPYVLIAGCFDRPGYARAVGRRYAKICAGFAKFWNEGGWGFTP